MNIGEKKRVLIAEDDRALAASLATRCRSLGIEVETVHDSLSALVRISEHHFDVVCLDVNMPAGNGLTVCEMMAAESSWSKIPVIILTGNQLPETIMRCHQLCAFYVLKCQDVWTRVEPLLRELLQLDAAVAADTAS